MEEVLRKLQAVSASLDQLNWRQELKTNQADKIDRIINQMDKEIEDAKREGKFTKEGLDEVVRKLGDEKGKVEAGIGQVDVNNESITSQTRKSQIKTSIVSKYDELFKQQEVIDQYLQEYDPENIIHLKESEMYDNVREMNDKKALLVRLKDFSSQPDIKEAVDIIKQKKEQKAKIDKALKIKNAIETAEANAQTIGLDQILVDQYKDLARTKREDLSALCTEIGVTYNDNLQQLGNELQSSKDDCCRDQDNAANTITVELNNSNHSSLVEAIGDLSNKTPEEIVDILNGTQSRIQGQILAIGNTNKRIQGQIDQLSKDIDLGDFNLNPNSTTRLNIMPSDDEIENDPEYQAALNNALMPTTRGEQVQARKDYLRSNGSGRVGAWFQSHFNKRNVDARIMADKIGAIKSQIKNRMMQERRNDARTKLEAQTRKDKWRSQYEVSVVSDILQDPSKDKDAIRAEAYKSASQKIEDESIR